MKAIPSIPVITISVRLPLDREYNEYKEFADKLMARIKQEG